MRFVHTCFPASLVFHIVVLHYAGKSKRGELSIFPKKFIILSQCLHMMQRPKIVSGSNNSKVTIFFYVYFCNGLEIYVLLTFNFIGQVADSWVPGRVRNLDAYTLKDQVLFNNVINLISPYWYEFVSPKYSNALFARKIF